MLGGIDNDLVPKGVHPGPKKLLVHISEQVPATGASLHHHYIIRYGMAHTHTHTPTQVHSAAASLFQTTNHVQVTEITLNGANKKLQQKFADLN